MNDETIDRTSCRSGVRRFRASSNARSRARSRIGDTSHRSPHRRERPNVLLMLTDDAGFGNPSHVRGPISTPSPRPAGRGRAPVQPLPCDGDVLADAGCADDRPQPPLGRLRHGQRVRRPFPGYSAMLPKDCQTFPKTLQGNGYSTACFGKWHLTPDHMQGRVGRSTAGRSVSASITSGASSAASPASSTRC